MTREYATPPPFRQAGTARSPREARLSLHLIYGLYAATLLTAFPIFIGVVIAYIQRATSNGSIYRSHYDHLIGIFWTVLILNVIAFVCVFLVVLVPVAWILWAVAWIITVVGVIKGWLRLLDDRPYRTERG